MPTSERAAPRGATRPAPETALIGISPVWHLAGLGLALVAFAALVFRTNLLIDDAFVTFRYARNWAEGLGPVYQAGDGAPVEGYSNFLWMAYLSAAARAGLPLPWVACITSVAAGVLLIVALHRFLVRELGLGPIASGAGTLALAAFPPFATWCTGGLETAPFALALFCTWSLLTSSRRLGPENLHATLAGLCAVAVVLLRVEGIGWVIVALCCGVISRALPAEHCGKRLARPRRILIIGFLAITGFALFLSWRSATYGAWTANTVDAKAGLSLAVVLRGLRATASYALLFVSPFFLLLVPWIVRPAEEDGRRPYVLAAALVFLGFFGFHVAVGGDWMPMFRFMAPATPFLAIVIACLVERLDGTRGALVGIAAVLAALLPAFGSSLVPSSLLQALYFREFRVGYETEWQRLETSRRNLENFVVLGKGLAQVAREEDSITLGAIGAIGYYSGARVLDRNGLVERSVSQLPADMGRRTAGHDKRVPRSFFQPQNPTWYEVILVQGRVEPGTPSYVTAAQRLGQVVFSNPSERALMESTVPEYHALVPVDGIPRDVGLMLLRRSEDVSEARTVWTSLGFR